MALTALLLATGPLTAALAQDNTGARLWECSPSVIRDDGSEPFHLYVDPGVPVANVVLETLSPRILTDPPGLAPILFRDDGTGGDKVAGDRIYTAGPFRHNPAYRLTDGLHLWNDVRDSPAGLDFLEVGDIRINDSPRGTRFLVGPSVGVIRSDLVEQLAPTVLPLASDLAGTSALLNIRTYNRQTQRWLRDLPAGAPGSAVSPAGLTRRVLESVPDSSQFIALLSTARIERLPALLGPNFNAGRHVAAKVDYTGTGVAPFDRTAEYGSRGGLMGVIAVDAGKRGLYSGNVTHELLHQWSPRNIPRLVDAEGHYPSRSNVGSLLGGQAWVFRADDGLWMECQEGRNGAHRASPLDLYMMGLLDARMVPDVSIYSVLDMPPLQRCGDVIFDYAPLKSMAEIIQDAGGVREPGPAAARRNFRISFVVETHGRFLTGSEWTFYHTLAEHYTRPAEPGKPMPLVGFNWGSITRFFGQNTTWSTRIRRFYDHDLDGDVDQLDLAHVQACAGQTIETCTDSDLDGDGDVDAADEALLAACLSGPGVPADLLTCADDRDGIGGSVDNCPRVHNPDQADSDQDGAGDACDRCPNADDRADQDQDDIPDGCDNCPALANPDQANSDSDGLGDACDHHPTCDNSADQDDDSVPDGCDNCPSVPNMYQADADQDGAGDACDRCPGFDDRQDPDTDGVPDPCDNCPITANTDQADADADTFGDACDPWPSCDNRIDWDADGAPDDCDNCPSVPNPSQRDADQDGIGDACEGPRVVSVVSRRTHGDAGDFDIDLSANPASTATECRESGPRLIVLQFDRPVFPADGTWDAEVSVSTGTATVASFDGSALSLDIANVPDASCLVLDVAGVISEFGVPLEGPSRWWLGVLAADVSGDGVVASADVTRVKSNSGATAGPATFRLDVNADGTVASADITRVKSRSGNVVSCP